MKFVIDTKKYNNLSKLPHFGKPSFKGQPIDEASPFDIELEKKIYENVENDTDDEVDVTLLFVELEMKSLFTRKENEAKIKKLEEIFGGRIEDFAKKMRDTLDEEEKAQEN